MNSYLSIQIEGYSPKKIITKLRSINVSVYAFEEKENIIYVKILSKDYEKVQKYLKTLEFKKVRYDGLEYLKRTFKRFNIFFMAILVSMTLIFVASNIIVDIDVIHEDAELVEIILEELEKNDVKKFHFRKSFKKLEEVKENIKNKNLDRIDWLEINKVGMRYVVRVEERIITEKEIPKEYCNLYATKDALVTKIKTFNGEAVVNINDYVKKGDLLVSGDVKLNEEVVSQVCASGNVYAEVWYEINIKVPFEYYEEIKTGKKRNNIIVNYDGVDHQLFKDRIRNYHESRKLVFDLLGVKIYLKTEEEISRQKNKYTNEEILEKAMNLATEKVKLKLKKGDKIINQKILQNTVIDSTMDIDIFIVAEEEISSQIEARKEAENGI